MARADRFQRIDVWPERAGFLERQRLVRQHRLERVDVRPDQSEHRLEQLEHQPWQQQRSTYGQSGTGSSTGSGSTYGQSGTGQSDTSTGTPVPALDGPQHVSGSMANLKSTVGRVSKVDPTTRAS